MSFCVPRRLTKTRGLAPNVTFGGRMTFLGSPGTREYHRTRNGHRKSERCHGKRSLSARSTRRLAGDAVCSAPVSFVRQTAQIRIPEGTAVLYMIIERFRDKDPIPVYRRFRDRGRLAPEGLRYVSSWVDEKLAVCFQIMETADRGLLDEWTDHWSDIVEFEIFPVISSKEAAEAIAPRL